MNSKLSFFGRYNYSPSSLTQRAPNQGYELNLSTGADGRLWIAIPSPRKAVPSVSDRTSLDARRGRLVAVTATSQETP